MVGCRIMEDIKVVDNYIKTVLDRIFGNDCVVIQCTRLTNMKCFIESVFCF